MYPRDLYAFRSTLHCCLKYALAAVTFNGNPCWPQPNPLIDIQRIDPSGLDDKMPGDDVKERQVVSARAPLGIDHDGCAMV